MEDFRRKGNEKKNAVISILHFGMCLPVGADILKSQNSEE